MLIEAANQLGDKKRFLREIMLQDLQIYICRIQQWFVISKRVKNRDTLQRTISPLLINAV
jgi:hypothetical protein